MSHPMLLRLAASKPLFITSACGLALGASTYYQSNQLRVRCDFGPPGTMAARKSYNEYLPPSDRSFNRMIGINSRTVKQLTTGSIAGLCVGVTLRIFSRALAFSVGAGILFFQWLASKGYHIFPSRWLEKKIHGVKLRHILDENAPFKLSMASTVLLAAFGELDAEE